MSKNSEHDLPIPNKIFVVVCDSKYRIYTREGQAVRWFADKIKEGKTPQMLSYIQES